MKREFKVGDPVIFDDMKFIVNHKYMTKRFVRGSHIFYDDEEFEGYDDKPDTSSSKKKKKKGPQPNVVTATPRVLQAS